MPKQRITSHEIETKATDIIRMIINADGRGLFRELSDRDYGIDAIVEMFDDGSVTGKFGLIQCKGTGARIEPLKRYPNYLSCSNITASNCRYLRQNNNAVILVYASTKDRENFYYVDLKDAISNKDLDELQRGCCETKTARIPVNNNAKCNLDGFFELIERYYRTV